MWLWGGVPGGVNFFEVVQGNAMPPVDGGSPKKERKKTKERKRNSTDQKRQ